MAFEFTLLPLAGPIGPNDLSILYQEVNVANESGVATPGSGIYRPRKLPAVASGFGRAPAKLLIVDGTTHIHDADPEDDIGWLLRSIGVDNNFIRIARQAVTPWDYSNNNAVFFSVIRESNGTVEFMEGPNANSFTASISGTTLTVTGTVTGSALAVGQVINSIDVQTGEIQQRTRISALGTGTGGAGTYTLQVAGAALSQTVSSRAMSTGVLMLNMEARGALQGGPPLGAISTEPDVWVIG